MGLGEESILARLRNRRADLQFLLSKLVAFDKFGKVSDTAGKTKCDTR